MLAEGFFVERCRAYPHKRADLGGTRRLRSEVLGGWPALAVGDPAPSNASAASVWRREALLASRQDLVHISSPSLLLHRHHLAPTPPPLKHAHAHTRTRSHTHTLTHSHTHTRTHSHTHPHTHPHTHTLTHSHTHTLTHSHTHTLTHPRTHTLTNSHTHTLNTLTHSGRLPDREPACVRGLLVYRDRRRARGANCLISQNVFIKSPLKSQFPYKSVNLSLF